MEQFEGGSTISSPDGDLLFYTNGVGTWQSNHWSMPNGDSIFVQGGWQTTSGTYTDAFISVAGCDSIVVTDLAVNDTFEIHNAFIVCEGDSIFAGGNWQTEARIYFDTKLTAVGCDSLITSILSIDPLPSVFLGNDTIFQEGEAICLDVFNPDATYLWQDGSDEPVFIVTEAGLYYVLVTNLCGYDIDSINIYQGDISCEVFSPNAFTPNGDQLNDVFLPSISCEIKQYELSIYDHWGKQLFQSNDPEEGWNGRFKGEVLPAGAYVWKLNFSVVANNDVSEERVDGVVILVL